MMISPECYVMERLYNKGIDGVQKGIRSLKRRINELKRILENPMQDDLSLFVDPSPLVELKCCFEYLEAAIDYLKEIGGEYLPSKSEQRSINFRSNIEHIKKITFCRCGCFEIRQPVEITFDGETVIRTEYVLDEPQVREMEDYDKEGFLQGFDRLMIGTWRRLYSPDRFGVCVFDGEDWDLKIEYDNNLKPQKYGGVNAYPFNFSELCDLLEVEKE